MAAWPGTLPVYWGEEGYAEQEANNVIRTPMDSGPEKIRRRSTAAPRPVSRPVELTDSQKSDLRTFYETTLNHGVDEFTMDDVTGTNRTYRFVEPPVYQYKGYNQWYSVLQLEEMY